MENSILKTVKSSLGLDVADTSFDTELILYTNSALGTLNQIGIGPEAGFQIEDATSTWTDLLGTDARLNGVKTLICTRVRLLFDPPAASFAVDAMTQVAKELETRLYLFHEAVTWVPTTPPDDIPDSGVIDGGTP